MNPTPSLNIYSSLLLLLNIFITPILHASEHLDNKPDDSHVQTMGYNENAPQANDSQQNKFEQVSNTPSAEQSTNKHSSTSDWDKAKIDANKAWSETKKMSTQAWEKTKKGSAKTWDSTKQTSAEVWEVTKDGSTKAWTETKKASSNTWKVTKENSGKAWKNTKEYSNKAWDSTKEAIHDGAEYVSDKTGK